MQGVAGGSPAPFGSLAGGALAIGALAMVAKGGARIATGADPSLVPIFAIGATVGLFLGAVTLGRDGHGPRWLLRGAAVLAGIGAVGGVVAVGYLVAGTIPETPGAPPLVAASYGVSSAGAFLSLGAIAVVTARRRALSGRWRWLPVGVLLGQFPIFAVSEAIGDAASNENVADGVSLVLTGLVWVALAFALARRRVTSDRSATET